MKKLLAVLVAAALVLSAGAVFAGAAETADVYVTISDKDGKLAVAAEKITVKDIDGDNALTVNDALYAAHEKFYEGGAAKGYATEQTQWGLSLAKLWGTANGGSYGYMVNNAAAWSMTDPVKKGDYVAAYVFTRPETLDDKYSYFDKITEDVKAGEITLTLRKNDFDKDWNPLTLPVEGAVITVDGKVTSVKTDKDGKATVKLDVNGRHIVSATAATGVIVPPVFVATVSGGIEPPTTAPTQAPTAAPTQAATQASTQKATVAPTQASTQKATVAPTQASTQKAATASKTSSSNTGAVQTGPEDTMVFGMATLAVLALAVIVTLRKKHEE